MAIDQEKIEHKFLQLSGDYMAIDYNRLNNILNENVENDIIYCLTNNNRIFLLDLYHYEKNNLVRDNITREVVDDFRNAFYSKHKKIINKKKKINIYIRRGDLHAVNKRKTTDYNFYNFEFLVFTYIYNNLKNEIENENKYEINIISAGSDDEMNEIKEQFSIFKNINFYLNQGQFPIFTILTQSDLLIFGTSAFPFTASLYSDALVIYRKNDYYLIDVTHIKNFLLRVLME